MCRALFVFLLCATGGVAAPAAELARVPARDEVVETQLLPSAVKQSVQRLAGVKPGTALATEFTPPQRIDGARRLIDAGRANGDPRTLGYAESLLAGMPDDGPIGVNVLVLRATIEQNQHRFDAARELLDRAVAQSPAHIQARLTRATIAHVRGDMAGARSDCDALRAVAPEVATVCRAIGDSLTGRNLEALAALKSVAASGTPTLRSWALSVAGEVYEQQNDLDAAVRSYATAVTTADDLYTRIALSDALIAQQRWQPAEAMLAQLPPTDTVLVRRFIVMKRLNKDAAALQTQLTERFAAAQARGEFLHAREAATFALEQNDVATALRLARENWKNQREPADLLLLARAARAANDAAALADIREWIARTGLADVRVERALKADKR